MNNQAIIIKINKIDAHPNADKIALAKLFGTQVVVGKDTQVGDILVYVDSNMRMSDEFLRENNLFRHCELNIDKTKIGFFEDNGRVKCIKMRGEISDGFLFPLDFFRYIGINVPETVGFEFDSVNGIRFCEKYIAPVDNKTGAHDKSHTSLKKIEVPMFVEHFSTDQFMKNKHAIPAGTICYLEEKIHGCVEKSTIIETQEFGNLTIGEIVDNKIKCSIKCFDTIKNKIGYAPIDDHYKICNDGDWYEIELENGTKLTITGNNPVWLPHLNSYKKVEELNGTEILLID